MSVTPRGMSVQEAYREYTDGNFIVNRKYQRKLVWSLSEKQKLIDSILKGYPIPLIILATKITEDGKKKYEIIDGMQRLNAVFSFIENTYDTEKQFFDINQLSRAKQVADLGRFSAKSDPKHLLDQNSCAKLLEYNFAVTEFPGTDSRSVNDVFGRINSYGKQLSSQEKRQAGVISPFANLVREIASELRGDVSADFLDLADMPEISIDVEEGSNPRGVIAENTFWCKQSIIRKNQLKEAEDEQLIADIAISILEQNPFAFSGTALDSYYNVETEEFREINSKLYAYGSDALKNTIISTLSVLREVIEGTDPSVGALKKIIHPEAHSNPIKTGFYALFMAFYELCIKEGKSPYDNKKIMSALRNLQGKLNVAAGQIRSEPRRQNINIIKGLIQDFFEEKDPGIAQQGAGLAIRFENALRRSKIETAAYECKQGIYNLDIQRTFNQKILDRLVETICGIANIGPESAGAIFIGVADKITDKHQIEAIDKITALSVGSRYVVGIDRELPLALQDIEKYKKKIVDHFRASGLSEPLKTAVLGKIDCIDYRGKSVICIWIPKQEDISDVNDVIYTREGSSTKKIEGYRAIQAVASRFKK